MLSIKSKRVQIFLRIFILSLTMPFPPTCYCFFVDKIAIIVKSVFTFEFSTKTPFDFEIFRSYLFFNQNTFESQDTSITLALRPHDFRPPV